MMFAEAKSSNKPPRPPRIDIRGRKQSNHGTHHLVQRIACVGEADWAARLEEGMRVHARARSGLCCDSRCDAGLVELRRLLI